MPTLCVNQQVVLDFVNVSVSRGVSLEPSVLRGNANRKSILCPFISSCAILRRIKCVLGAIWSMVREVY